MAAVLTQWEQTGVFEPLNPNQKQYIYYAQVPGTYASYYYNKVPAAMKLQGALGALASSDWFSALAVAVGGVALGFLGMRYVGPPLKKRLGLNGHRRRR